MTKHESLTESWYYLCRLKDLSASRTSKFRVGPKSWIAYRDQKDTPIVLASRCSHMGTDLDGIPVKNGIIHCPLHNWAYDSAGKCVDAPHCDPIPPFAKLGAYPVQIRHGLVFVYNGEQAKFPLPFFFGENPDDFISSNPIHLKANCRWDLASANAFDVYHFEQFHGRKLNAPASVSFPDPKACRIQHEFTIVKPSLADRLLILSAGNIGNFDYTSWQGNFILLKVGFRKLSNYLQIVFYPLGPEQTGVDIIVLKNKDAVFGVPLWLKRWMTDLFFRPEAEQLKHVFFNPSRAVSQDALLVRYLDWLGGLES